MPFMRHGLARQQRAPDAQELVGDGVADGVVEEQAVALELDRPPPVTTLIKSRPSEMRSSVPPCARRRRGLQAGTHGDQEAQPFGQGASPEATTQLSSQERPVGSRTP